MEPTIKTGYAVETIDLLKSIPSSKWVDGYVKIVKKDSKSKPSWYIFDESSTLTGDNDAVIVPNGNPSKGRFIKINFNNFDERINSLQQNIITVQTELGANKLYIEELINSIKQDSISGQIEFADNKRYVLDPQSSFKYGVNKIFFACKSGSCKITIKVYNEQDQQLLTTGLLDVTADLETIVELNNFTVKSNQSLVLDISNVASATDLIFSLQTTRL